MRESQSFFCSGVAPTVIGSLPRNVARTAVAMPEVDPRHLLADAIHVECAAAEAAELLRNKQELNPELVRAAHVTHDFQRAFVARVQGDEFLRRPAASWRTP